MPGLPVPRAALVGSLRSRRVPGAVLSLAMVTAVALGAGVALFHPWAARAATTTLTTCTYGALASAISGSAAGDTIHFGCGGTITFTAPITIPHSLTLDGSGESVTLSGGGKVQVLIVNSTLSLTLIHLTIADGLAQANSARDGAGGGVEDANGSVTITNCVFEGNQAIGDIARQANGGADGDGGAILVSAGNLTVTGTTFVGNTAIGGSASDYAGGGWGYGGAIFSEAGIGTSVRLSGDTFTNNTARGGVAATIGTGGGGAVEELGGATAISGSIFTGNIAFGGTGPVGGTSSGGAIDLNNVGSALPSIVNSSFIRNEAVGAPTNTTTGQGGGGTGGAVSMESATVHITGSTFANNAAVGGNGGAGTNGIGAAGSGGAIGAIPRTTFTLVNSTITGNSVRGGTGGVIRASVGGGIYTGAATTLTNDTVAGNSAQGTGSDLQEYNSPSAGLLTVANSIVANGAGSANCSGPITDGGYNLDSGTSCGFSTTHHDRANTNPMLGVLGNYGGQTEILPLQHGSPAIDAIPSGTAGCGTTLTADQRGVSRPYGVGCDLGAYESTPLATSTTLVGWPNPAVQGRLVTLEAHVLRSVAASPGGLVSFYDGSRMVAVVAPVGGWAVARLPWVAAGTHGFTARYGGDLVLGPSVSPTLTIIVKP